MSLSKFIITESGKHFYHDNRHNVLLDDKKNPLYRPFQQPSDWDDLKDRFSRKDKTNSPETMKITLGHGCNYSCGYCMQKDIGNPNERAKNGLTPLLIKNINRHLKLGGLKRFELWGGETLLYWNDIVEIINQFDRPGIQWYIPTNGTPLQHKHIDFFSKLQGDVAMGISHDGPAHEKLRGKEFLHKKVEIFKRIQEECFPKIQFSFNPVISVLNYDLFKINQFFYDYFNKNDLKPTTLSFELGRVYDQTMAKNSTHHVITGEHKDKYRLILRRYLNKHHEQYQQHGYTKQGPLLANSLFHTGMGVIPYIKTLRDQTLPLMSTNCGVDDSRLISMDMSGNIRTCQNTDESFTSGNLIAIKDVTMSKVNIDRQDFCGTCPVNRLCKSSCPLDLGDEVFHTNHEIEYIHYGEIQLAAFRILFNSDVQLVETGIESEY